MVEQTCPCHAHCHAEAVTCVNNLTVTDGAAGLNNIGYAALLTSFDIVTEGEESIGSEGYACDCVKVCSLFFSCKGSGLFCEEFLPLSVSKDFVCIVGKVNVNAVVSLGSAE